jgi:glycosyltransferase involved in cell wall biosynthesis
VRARVGLDLREIRPVHSGGIRVFLRDLLDSLVLTWPDAVFHVFQTEGDPPLLAERPGAVTVEPIATAEPRGTVDARSLALGLDVLFRGFPAGLHGFPPERQLVLVTDLQHEALPEMFTPDVLHDRRRRFDAALSRAGAIAVPSEFSRRAVAGHPETRCTEVVVVPGAAPRVATPPRPPASGGGAVPYFLFPANLWPHKNHRRVLQALRSFLERTGRAAELRLTGDPAGWEALGPDAAGLPVRHLGWVSEAELAVLYRDALALVFLTLYEGFGLPLLEAFNHGVPVLGSDRGSVPEIGGEAVLACDPTDVAAMAEGLARIATDQALRDRLVRAGRSRLGAYSWERSARVLRAALERLVGPREAARAGPGRAPELSVIIALTDDRGLAAAVVESATRLQDCPRDAYEVIVVTDGAEPAREPGIRALLGRADRLTPGWTRNGAALADRGARLARGRVLFFTEGHCELSPGTVRELIAFFEAGEHDAACVSCTGRSANTFGRMEQQAFDQHFRAWREPGDWRKVLFRGFAVLRRVYDEAGGFESRYGLFADRALAATLHVRGYRTGWAERATVVHGNVRRYRELRASVTDYVSGELAYRQAHDAGYCARYFGEPAEWVEWRDWPPEDARLALRAVAASLAGGAALAPAGEAVHLLGPALLGRAWARMRGRAGVAWAGLRYLALPGEGERRYRAYTDLWHWTARLVAARYLKGRPGSSARPAAPAGDVSAAALDRYRSFGFHAVERLGDRPFRWTGALAGVWLALPPGRHRVTLHTEPLRPRGAVSVCWNGTRLRGVERRDREISFEVTARPDAGSAQSLIVVAEPVRRRDRSPDERRRLGLPLFGLRTEPAG